MIAENNLHYAHNAKNHSFNVDIIQNMYQLTISTQINNIFKNGIEKNK